MAGRRTVDTSGMFRSMTGHTAQDEAVAKNPAAEEPAQTRAQAPARKDTSAAKKSAKKKNTADPMDRQTVKLGFYLTPRIYEALQLHKTVNFIGAHNDSQIINNALAAYLSRELTAMNATDKTLAPEERLKVAAMKLMNTEG